MEILAGGTELKLPERFIELVGSDKMIYKQFRNGCHYYYYLIIGNTLFHGETEDEIFERLLEYSKERYEELHSSVYNTNHLWVDHMKWYFANLKSKNKK
jgi:hypothetical protein